MRTVQATGSSITAFDLIAPTFFVLALLVNAVLPYLGMAQESATCTLVLANAGTDRAHQGAAGVLGLDALHSRDRPDGIRRGRRARIRRISERDGA